jgi:puromycin-sensitive aminopeptidase
VAPSRYDVTIIPDLAAGRFSGSVTIAIEANAALDEVVCNAIGLELESAHLDGQPVTWRLDEPHERLHIQAALPPGQHRLTFQFNGPLNDKLRGFYRSTWTGADGVEHVLGTTHMQPGEARRVFPCWDEPSFKAVFAITVVVEPGHEVISNSAELDRRQRTDGTVAVRFADTISMSTYLVAWVVGELEFSDAADVDGIAVRVVSVPGKRFMTAWALQCATFSLRYFQDYYGIAYPSTKCDLVAIPDFAAGAMENLGCITFRESLLLVHPERTTPAEQQQVADVVMHEMAHMWFGDLVTMRWWNGTWLNEAFATFMELIAVDAFRPQWRRWDTFSVERTAAFDLDGLSSTRPVEFAVHSPAETHAMFDVLTYQKGGALLRMLEQYLGPEAFRSGVRRYLTTHAYGNTETSDLWDAVEAATGEPVRAVMDSWIWCGGFPLVSAHLRGESLELRQQPFAFAESDEVGLWSIPVLVANGGAVIKLLLTEESATVQLPHPTQAVIVNHGAHGYYRVAYDETLASRLTGSVLASLSPAERYGLIDDAWSAVLSGRTDIVEFCRLLRQFADQADLATWRLVTTALTWCDRFVEGSARAGLQGFVRALVAAPLATLGWDRQSDEPSQQREIRALLLRTLAVLGNDPQAQDRARQLLAAAWRGEQVAPELEAAATTVVAQLGTAQDYAGFVAQLQVAPTPQHLLRYSYALAEFPGADEMTATLEMTRNGAVKAQNVPFVLARCIANREHGAQAWRYVATHWSELNDRVAEVSVIRMVEGIRTLTQPEQVAEIDAFFAEHPLPQAGKTLAQHLERQRINAALRQRATPALTAEFA